MAPRSGHAKQPAASTQSKSKSINAEGAINCGAVFLVLLVVVPVLFPILLTNKSTTDDEWKN